MSFYDKIYTLLLEIKSSKPSAEEIEASRARAEALMSGELEMMGSQTRSGSGRKMRKALSRGATKAIKSYQTKNPVPRLRGKKRWH